MEEKPPGRPPGYTHSEETKQKIVEAAARRKHTAPTRQKIAEAAQRRSHAPETRRKISETMRGQEKSESHREKISFGKLDIDGRCMARLAELKANYPDHAEFFEENEIPLLIALREVKSDKEIDDIKKYIETGDIDRYSKSLSYQSSSSSFQAHEDTVIDLLDYYHKCIRTNI